MSQLVTLFWLRLVIFRNSMTGRREIVSTVLRFVILGGYLLISLLVGLMLFLLMVRMPDTLGGFMANSMGTIFGMLVFLTLVTQATGTSANFDPRRFILFPISFKNCLRSTWSQPLPNRSCSRCCRRWPAFCWGAESRSVIRGPD